MTASALVPDAPRALPRWVGQPWLHLLTPSVRAVVGVAGIALAGLYWRFGAEPGLLAAAWCVLLAALPALAAADLIALILPSRIIYSTAAGVAGLMVAAAAAGDLSPRSLGLGAVAAVAALVVGFFVVLAAPRGGLGLGDVRLGALLALVLGTHALMLPLVAFLVVAPLLAIVPTLVATRSGASVAFGPYLALATVLGAFWPGTLLAVAS